MPRAQKDNVSRFTVNGEPYEIDATDLSLGEVAEIEAHFDCDVSELHETQDTLGTVYTAMKRVDPTVTWETVSAVRFTQVKVNRAKRPTQAAPDAAGTPAS